MPSYLATLPVILAVLLVMHFIAGWAYAGAMQRADSRRIAVLYGLLVTSAYLAPNIWVYLGALLMWLYAVGKLGLREDVEWRATLWMAMLMAVPAIRAPVPGFGIVGYLFAIDHVRALSLFVLAPLALSVRHWAQTPRFGRLPTDWAVLAFVAAQLVLTFPYGSRTDWARQSFLVGVDVWLPYWVMSRAFYSRDGLGRAVGALLLVGAVVACLGMVEAAMSWPMFDGIELAWNQPWTLTIFLMRDGFLRARSSLGQSLAFGYAMAVCLCLWFWYQQRLRNWTWRGLGFVVFAGALVASLSRGSWFGATVMLLVLAAMGRRPAFSLLTVVAAGVAAFAVLAAFVPTFESLLNKLPLIGDSSAGDPDVKEYRQRILEAAVELLQQSPVVGVPGYLSYMEELRQGQGIIDIVNTYVAVGLGFGLLGLVPFVLIFLLPILSLWRMRRAVGADSEGGQFARTLIATLLGVMVMIFSTSSISVVAPIYYMLSGLAVAGARIYLTQHQEEQGEITRPFPGRRRRRGRPTQMAHAR